MINLLFEKPGLFTSVQDLGRLAYQAFGVPVGGSMDRFSAKMANTLVGNPKESPVLEITLLGPKIYFLEACQIALCGADLSPSINNTSIQNWETIDIKAGDRLQFGKAKSGCRVYLAIRGEWKVQKWLDSASLASLHPELLTPQSFIRKGSSLSIESNSVIEHQVLPRNKRPNYPELLELGVYPGPEFESIARESIVHFFQQTFTVGSKSDRMGYQLEPAISGYKAGAQLISSGVLPGVIQLTNAGQPIVLMADAQTVGGYPRIAVLDRRSRDAMAQSKAGDRIRFRFQKT